MKKLLLLLSLLLATNAWAELKTLDCEVLWENTEDGDKVKFLVKIDLDLELNNAEIILTDTKKEETVETISELLVSPTKLTFTSPDGEAQIMVNRQDLGITVRDKPHSLYRGYVDSGTGKCKIVRGKKNLI